MTWRDLLFAHWPMPPDALRPLIPPPLELDLFDGEAWLGIVPFRMTHVRPLGLPLPGEAFAFAEVNVRTYVRGPDGTAGVWFLSLDGQHRAGAAAARLAFGVPYRYARVTSRIDDGWIRFASRHDGSPPAELRASFRPVGPVRHAAPGSLEAFLTNRLTLFARRGGQVWRGDIHHGPWPLQDAELEVERDTMASSHGLSLPATPPVLQFAGRLETVAYRPVPIG
jgi:uncharacterized protein YqjF (DUF2071 family)